MKIREDLMLHASVTCLIVIIANMFIPFFVAVFIALGLSMGKELYDKYSKTGTACWSDLAADLVGIIAAIGVIFIDYKLKGII